MAIVRSISLGGLPAIAAPEPEREPEPVLVDDLVNRVTVQVHPVRVPVEAMRQRARLWRQRRRDLGVQAMTTGLIGEWMDGLDAEDTY
jgi:hypothetical protein